MSRSRSPINLTPTSHIVLGCLSLLGGEATPYQIKQLLSFTLGTFHPYPHSGLYAEADRLAQAGYARMHKEQRGRERTLYTLTAKGRDALSEWRGEPVHEPFEVRDGAIVKLFFGGDARALAESQVEALRAELSSVQELRERYRSQAPEGPLLAADYGIRVRRSALAFWEEIARGR